jgi:hypothetical protein
MGVRCLGHVNNLGIFDFMSFITKTAIIETKQAIWDYDPDDPNNRILGGDLDVIAIIRTLAVKVLSTLVLSLVHSADIF